MIPIPRATMKTAIGEVMMPEPVEGYKRDIDECQQRTNGQIDRSPGDGDGHQGVGRQDERCRDDDGAAEPDRERMLGPRTAAVLARMLSSTIGISR